MKKNLTFITMVAATLLCSCGSETSETAVQEVTKPNVKIAQVTAQMVAQTERFATTVEAEVKNNIIPNAPLRIDKILVEVGDNVVKGQKLVELDASNLEQLTLQIENQRIEFNRVAELYKVGGASKAEYDNAKTALEVNEKALKNRLENTVLVSPINGVVSARNYDNGDMYGGQPILVVEQITPVKMKVNVSEKYYSKVKKGSDVELQFETYGDEVFTGKVNIVYPTIDPTTHTFPVEITLSNNDRRVRPGMFGHATINFGEVSHVVVPDAAVIKQAGSGDYYIYTYANGKVSYDKIQIGKRMGDRYELISGVASGAEVVIAGQNALANGVEVQVIK
jgi:RND family efflux transporter MFP subunit